MTTIAAPLGKITGTQPALMYALGKLARGGATRGGYVSRLPQIRLGGSWSGASAPRRVLIASLTIQDLLNETPNTCTFTVQGARPSEGSDITIAFGSINAGTRLFGGTALRVQEVYVGQRPMSPPNVLFHVEGIDYTWGLNAILVSARYRSQSATTIGRDLLARWAPAGYSAHIAEGLPQIDEISFTLTPLMECLTQLAQRIGGYARCDYFRRVWLFVDPSPDAAPPPRALTADHPSLESVAYSRDLSQMVTRALVEGGGVNALGPVTPGDTRLPVDDTAWYQAAGGWVVSGPQRIRYTGMVASGTGAMASAVGGATGNTSPPTAPTVTTTAGAGLTPGTYKYAYTWVTASGETLPSALATWDTGTAPGPPTAPTATAQNGTGLGIGRYRYAFSWATSGATAGETLLSPLAEVTTASQTINPPNSAPTLTRQTGPGLPEGTYRYGVTFVSATGETTLGPTSIVTTETGVQQVTVGIPTGPSGVTGRKVYRTVKNGAQLKLLATLTNNVATALPAPDTTPDTSLGATPPTSNTTTTNNRQVGLSSITVGPTGTAARNVYRTVVNGTDFQLLTVLANNSTTTFIDTTPDGALGRVPPPAATANLALAVLGTIAVGPAATTSRKVYRTAVNTAQLKLLTTIANNTATAIAADATPDASLGANAPVTDTSGLVSGSGGQVNAGATTIPVANVTPFAPEGWASIGDQLIRYTGVSATALTGVPVTGIGSLGVAIPYNATITVAPQVTGIPASGPGSIALAILAGDPVNLLVIVDDLEAQAWLQAALGGPPATGVIEGYLQDRRISYAEANSRALALLDQKGTVLETVRYRVRDPRTISGATISVDLPAPMEVRGSYAIQDVTISGFLGRGTVNPIYDVVASSARFSFEELIRRRREAP